MAVVSDLQKRYVLKNQLLF